MFWKVGLVVSVKGSRMFEILFPDMNERCNRHVDQIRKFTSQIPNSLICSESVEWEPSPQPLIPISDPSPPSALVVEKTEEVVTTEGEGYNNNENVVEGTEAENEEWVEASELTEGGDTVQNVDTESDQVTPECVIAITSTEGAPVGRSLRPRRKNRVNYKPYF